MINSSLILTALLAGVAGGSHCVGMCGGIATVLSRSGAKTIPIVSLKSPPSVHWSDILQLHAGRLLTYALAGGLAGSFAAVGLLLKPVLPVQSFLFIVGNLSLIYLGLRCLGYQPALLARVGATLHLSELSRSIAALRLPAAPLARGMLWGCLPCGLVYAVLPMALVSGAAWSGALLMICFGLGTLPYLLFAQGMAQRFGRRKPPLWLALGAATILIGLGCLGLLMPTTMQHGGWWC